MCAVTPKSINSRWKKPRARCAIDSCSAQARAHHAGAVAVGHTADDQVETILMHFLRGAGLAGLKGMTGRTMLTEFDREIPLVRPILHLWRARDRGLLP